MDRAYSIIPHFLLSSRNNSQMASVQLYKEYPLVVAIKQEAPDDVVLALAKAYQKAIFTPSKNGEMPYYIALRASYSKVVLDALSGRSDEYLHLKGSHEQYVINKWHSENTSDSGDQTDKDELLVDRRNKYARMKTASSFSRSHSRLHQDSKDRSIYSKSERNLQTSFTKSSRVLYRSQSVKFSFSSTGK